MNISFKNNPWCFLLTQLRNLSSYTILCEYLSLEMDISAIKCLTAIICFSICVHSTSASCHHVDCTALGLNQDLCCPRLFVGESCAVTGRPSCGIHLRCVDQTCKGTWSVFTLYKAVHSAVEEIINFKKIHICYTSKQFSVLIYQHSLT